MQFLRSGEFMDLRDVYYNNINSYLFSVSPILISRFKEREENVKSDIFQVYISLLRQTKHIASALPNHKSVSEGHPVARLRSQVPAIVKSVTRQLREKSFKTRQVRAVTILPVDSSPVDSSPVDSSPVDSSPVDSLPVDTLPVDSLPVDSLPVDSLPVDSSLVNSLPVDSLPVDSSLVNSLPVDSSLVNSLPVDSLPVDSSLVNSLPVNSLPVDTLPVDTLSVDILVDLTCSTCVYLPNLLTYKHLLLSCPVIYRQQSLCFSRVSRCWRNLLSFYRDVCLTTCRA